MEGSARLLIGLNPPTPYTYMATGTGAGAESPTSTALENENTQYGAQRAQANLSYISLGVSQWSILYAFTGSVTIREIGIFNSTGDMFLRHVLNENKNYSDGESVEITITNTNTRVLVL